jgi:hypothetical protein
MIMYQLIIVQQLDRFLQLTVNQLAMDQQNVVVGVDFGVVKAMLQTRTLI